EQACNVYASFGLAMQCATSYTLLGLFYYDLGNRGNTDLYAEAVRCYGQALNYFRQARMLDIAWKILLYLALTLFHLGRLALTGDEQKTYWHRAAALESDSVVTEYVMLRRGNPVGWNEIVPLLQIYENDK
ncbi:MAG: hypothetical protein M3Z24_14500, partial [Chloroflexota bacterium]|nr:hypothetical protein [Chloroflexota bacterium]